MLNSLNNQDRVYYKESFRDVLAIGAGHFPGDPRYQTFGGVGSIRKSTTSQVASSVGAKYRSVIMVLLEDSLQLSRRIITRLLNPSLSAFAAFEIEEAESLLDILKDMATHSAGNFVQPSPAPVLVEGPDADYLQWQLENHQNLQSLTRDYLDHFPAYASAADRQTRQLATLALARFDEHLEMLEAACEQQVKH